MKSKTAGMEPRTDFLWSREDYEELVRCGVFGPEDRIELLNGRLMTMSPQNAPHATAYSLVCAYLTSVFDKERHVRTQLPIALDDRSEPEPDLAVVRGEIRNYLDGHPTPADCVLLVEIADSSLSYDRGEKLAAYARAGIPEYWILNIEERVLEIYREPVGESFGEKQSFGPDDSVAPSECEDAAVKVAELLP